MSTAGWKAAIVGVTGAVGRTMIACLAESGLDVRHLRGFATERSAGLRLPVAGPWGEGIEVEGLPSDLAWGCDLVLLSAGAEVSRRLVPSIARQNCWVVDNSSAFRMDPEVPLVVPEVNAETLPVRRGAIANPNCSTIQMVVVLDPIRRRFGLRRVHVATYQSVSGSGRKGIDALRAERRGGAAPVPVYPHPIDGNLIPQCDVFLEDGFTREEEKMIRETRRILGEPDLAVHPTCVRVPVDVGHGEVLHLELERPVSREEVVDCLAGAPGLRIEDEPGRSLYPTPRSVAGGDDVVVGRIRRDRSDPRIIELWVVADNLRKGAAVNAVQIAVRLYEREGGGADLPHPA